MNTMVRCNLKASQPLPIVGTPDPAHTGVGAKTQLYETAHRPQFLHTTLIINNKMYTLRNVCSRYL